MLLTDHTSQADASHTSKVKDTHALHATPQLADIDAFHASQVRAIHSEKKSVHNISIVLHVKKNK
jgi:hypothetical protein